MGKTLAVISMGKLQIGIEYKRMLFAKLSNTNSFI